MSSDVAASFWNSPQWCHILCYIYSCVVPSHLPGLAYVTNRTQQKQGYITSEITLQEYSSYLGFSLSSLPLRESNWLPMGTLREPVERPTWHRREVSGQHLVRKWDLPTTTWVSLILQPLMTIVSGDSSTATVRETLSQNHSAKPLPDSWETER